MEGMKELFKKLVQANIANNTYLGIGDYEHAEILFVGKEGSHVYQENKKNNDEISFAREWAAILDSNGRKTSKDSNEYRYPSGHTWSKYQKLHDVIYPAFRHTARMGVNFTERIFTTEMSTIRCKNTSTAQKDPDFDKQLKERKENFFKNTEFIQAFPVVVLACSNYISENDIRDIFGVVFDRKYEIPSRVGKRNFSFCIYYNREHSKLVIHTRQLSGAIPDELLEEIGNCIKDFMRKSI